MGKKSFYKIYRKRLIPFVKNHRVVFATIAGAAGGILVSTILGTEKAKQFMATAENRVKDLQTT